MRGVSLTPFPCPWRWHICKSASSPATICVIYDLKVQEIAVWFVRLQFSVQYGLKNRHACPVLPQSLLQFCNDLPWKSKRILVSDCQARSGNQPRLKKNGQKAENDQRSSSLFSSLMNASPKVREGRGGVEMGEYGRQKCSFSERVLACASVTRPWTHHTGCWKGFWEIILISSYWFSIIVLNNSIILKFKINELRV